MVEERTASEGGLAAFLQQVRSGAFLDKARIRRIAVIYLAVTIVSFAVLLATSNGFLDRMGRPLGTDFMAFHVAGTIALEEGGAAAYDPARQYAEHQDVLASEAPSYWPFLYPPSFLIIAMGLAALPYLAGWLLWMGSTLAIYAGAMQRLQPGGFALLLALAFPPVYTNFLHGQNGFLIAAFFALAASAFSSGRLLLAGALLGLISIKPQYGLLVPVALAAAGQWRAFAAAAITVSVLIVLPSGMFGLNVWPAFFETMSLARHDIVEAGAIGFEKIQSAFAQARILGLPTGAAYALQALVVIALAATLFRLWRGAASNSVKFAALIIASVAATPYAVDYDLVVLAPAIALLAKDGLERGFLPFEKSIYLFAAFAPVIARPIGAATHVSLGFIALAALYWIALRRAR